MRHIRFTYYHIYGCGGRYVLWKHKRLEHNLPNTPTFTGMHVSVVDTWMMKVANNVSVSGWNFQNKWVIKRVSHCTVYLSVHYLRLSLFPDDKLQITVKIIMFKEFVVCFWSDIYRINFLFTGSQKINFYCNARKT